MSDCELPTIEWQPPSFVTDWEPTEDHFEGLQNITENEYLESQFQEMGSEIEDSPLEGEKVTGKVVIKKVCSELDSLKITQDNAEVMYPTYSEWDALVAIGKKDFGPFVQVDENLKEKAEGAVSRVDTLADKEAWLSEETEELEGNEGLQLNGAEDDSLQTHINRFIDGVKKRVNQAQCESHPRKRKLVETDGDCEEKMESFQDTMTKLLGIIGTMQKKKVRTNSDTGAERGRKKTKTRYYHLEQNPNKKSTNVLNLIIPIREELEDAVVNIEEDE